MHYRAYSVLGCALALLSSPAMAEDIVITKEAIDVIWLATAAALVFLMQMGFAFLESGSSRSKNCVNVMMKNFMDVCLGSIIFWALGFGLMFGANSTGWIGTSGFFMHSANSWDYSFLLFQMMFAATVATIASGAMAERAKFTSYLILAVVIIGFIYPLFGSWAWGSFYEGAGLLQWGLLILQARVLFTRWVVGLHSLPLWCLARARGALVPRAKCMISLGIT